VRHGTITLGSSDELALGGYTPRTGCPLLVQSPAIRIGQSGHDDLESERNLRFYLLNYCWLAQASQKLQSLDECLSDLYAYKPRAYQAGRLTLEPAFCAGIISGLYHTCATHGKTSTSTLRLHAYLR